MKIRWRLRKWKWEFSCDVEGGGPGLPAMGSVHPAETEAPRGFIGPPIGGGLGLKLPGRAPAGGGDGGGDGRFTPSLDLPGAAGADGSVGASDDEVVGVLAGLALLSPSSALAVGSLEGEVCSLVLALFPFLTSSSFVADELSPALAGLPVDGTSLLLPSFSLSFVAPPSAAPFAPVCLSVAVCFGFSVSKLSPVVAAPSLLGLGVAASVPILFSSLSLSLSLLSVPSFATLSVAPASLLGDFPFPSLLAFASTEVLEAAFSGVLDFSDFAPDWSSFLGGGAGAFVAVVAMELWLEAS